MRIIEITNNLLLPITNEESDLLDKFSSEDSMAKDSLNDREKLLANQLTVKDVLLRTNDNGKIYYKKRAN